MDQNVCSAFKLVFAASPHIKASVHSLIGFKVYRWSDMSVYEQLLYSCLKVLTQFKGSDQVSDS